MKVQAIDYLALWGAVLSTLLALAKFWEIWKSRNRVEISHNFTGNDDIGNEVIIRNLGGTPLLITYWELLWLQRHWFRWKQSHAISADWTFEDLNFGGHTSIKLSFREENAFDWSASAMGKDKIYLHLHIADRSRPILRKVYG
jgi:hypothetical protein